MKTILIVEDNEIMLQNTAEILELSNYEVLLAKNGQIGLEVAKDKHPDLIISDVMMPEMDGFELLKRIRKSRGMHNLPFIFMTSRAERYEINSGFEEGANEYLTKPFDGADLLRVVEKCLDDKKNWIESIGID